MSLGFGFIGRRVIAAVGVVGLAAFLSLGRPASAETKVALVVGNGVYQNVPQLPNSPHDAADIAAAFLRLGFSVRLVIDANYDTLRRALIEFDSKARDTEMAMVFFAGHGMEVDGENWLIPIDAKLKSDTDIEQEAISLRAIMQIVSSASKLGLVVLDACRVNPFLAKMKRTTATRSVGRGLGRVEPTNNVLVAYAAKDGTTAADGVGRNSPFTTALLKHLETPGLEINFLFRNVRDEVIAATTSEQQPFIYGSLTKEAIYLKPPTTLTFDHDQAAWALLKETTDAAALKLFVAQYPDSPLRRAAEARITSLDAARATKSGLPPTDELGWQLLKETNDQRALARFIEKFPDSPLRKEAEARIAALGRAQAAAAGRENSMDRRDLVRSLQLELKQVGCFDGAMNGEFDAATRTASQKFTKLTSVELPEDLTPDTIKTLRAIDKRVCPLACAESERPAGDRCVPVPTRHCVS